MKAISIDPTEGLRRTLAANINHQPAERPALESQYGQVWDAAELARDFEVLGFAAPLVVVRRRADGQVGSLFFQHHPRLYFAYKQDQ